MRILMMAINDPAGTAIAFSRAINKYTDHSCRLITKEIRYNFMFEKDLHLPWLNTEGWDEVEELLKTSDIFHFHMTADEDIELGPFRPRDYIKGKTIVHHHHGHPDFRDNPEKYRQKYKKLKRKNLLVSTPDLLKLLPEAKWQPNLVPQNEKLYQPLSDKPEQPLIVAHSPTRTDLKNTDLFLSITRDFASSMKKGPKTDLIQNTDHADCLRRKRRAHILFDHLQGYFGVSSLEGLSQGICTIAGLDSWNQDHVRKFSGASDLPWYISSARTLKKELHALIHDKDMRGEYSINARKFIENHWTDKKTARHLIAFCKDSQ